MPVDGSFAMPEKEHDVPTLRTKNEPGVEKTVPDNEALDLTRMGLVLDTKATTPEGVRRAAERQTAQEG